MITVTLENAPPRLKGTLRLWLVEIHPGTYAGDLSAKVRERLWNRIRSGIGKGTAVMAWTERGHMHILTMNARLQPVSIDGLTLTKRTYESARHASRIGLNH